MKRLLKCIRRRPFAALYALGAALLLLSMLAACLLDGAMYALGLLEQKTVTLADEGQHTLVNLDLTGADTLVSTTGDAQLLLTPGARVRRLRLVADYEGDGGEKDLYYHLPGFGYTPALRVWPTLTGAGDAWLYTVPVFAGVNLRLDLADTAGVALRLEAIVLNEPLPWYRYFLPTARQLFLLAVAPGLLGCALTLRRPDP